MTSIGPTDASHAAETSNISYPSSSHVYTGVQYAFKGAGGFSTTVGFDTVHRSTETLISKYDTTGAVEILFDVRLFNALLGIQKDSSGVKLITNNFYDSSNNVLINDSITLTAGEFLSGINYNKNILSVGKYGTLYSDFNNYVAAYFGLTGPTTTQQETGFGTLFTGAYDFNPHSSAVFDASAFRTLINGTGSVSTTGSYVNALSGSITISNITQLLRNAVDSNCFGNRDPSAGTTAADASHNNSNYGVSDGFLADDIIFIPSGGLGITLNVAVDAEAFISPLNNIGPKHIANSTAITASKTEFNANTTATSTFSEINTATTTLISRTVSAPLMFRLANLCKVSVVITIGITTNNSIQFIVTVV